MEGATSPEQSEIADPAQKADPPAKSGRRLLWEGILGSLWAPLCAFGIAFVPYVILIEFSRPSYVWARPLLNGFGLLMLAYFVGLLLYRIFLPSKRQLRRLRRVASETLSELRRLLARHGDRLEPKARERLTEQAERLKVARGSEDAARLEEEIKRLSELLDKYMSNWRKASAIDFGLGFVKALAIALLIRTIIVEPFKIPSGSMLPTLAVGDQVFVNKFIYGVRIPFTNYVPFVIVRPPMRGDVIVFNNPVDESKDFIKRVVGLPGDTVEILDEVVHINGIAQEREKTAERTLVYNQDYNSNWVPEPAVPYDENLWGVEHAVLSSRPRPLQGVREGPWKVPEGQVFVMGDNRDNSSDSRYGLGVTNRVEFVPYGNIKGKAMVIWLSLSYQGLGSSLFGGTGLRTDRLFLPVR